jgi:hypothetical protein
MAVRARQGDGMGLYLTFRRGRDFREACHYRERQYSAVRERKRMGVVLHNRGFER